MLGSSMIAATIPVTDLERDVKSIDYAEDRCRPQDTSHKSVRLEAHGYGIRMATSLGFARGSGRQPPNGGRTTVKTAPRREPSNKSWP